MATLFSFSSLHCVCFSSSTPSSFSSSSSSPSFAFCSFPLRSRTSTLKVQTIKKLVVKAVEEETQQELNAEQPSISEAQPVVVPISPSDTLTMFFQAEGTVNEIDIPALTKVLEETEGVTDLKIQLAEGLAILELKKLTTVQATGVASGLVETIQGSGFKLQTLNLSFEDEEVAVA